MNRRPRRLVAILRASHFVLAAILTGALALMLLAVARMNGLIGEVRERDLGAIDEEEDLHRAAWAIEVDARHALEACQRGEPEGPLRARFEQHLAELRAVGARVGAEPSRAIRAAVAGYERLADRALQTGPCATLAAAGAARDQLRLDEELTDAWIQRLFELHRSASRTEERARTTGARALAVGGLLGVVGIVLALRLAQRIARGVSEPVADLARAARRVGEGSFEPFPPPRGPAELVELARTLDAMRSRLAELDALKQGFIASVSHEMRTPLAKLREALALLDDGATGPLSERQARVVRIAQNACEREIRIVNALLDLSRLRSGGPLRRTPGQSLDEALRRALDEERGEAETRGVALELEARGEVPTATLDVPLLERAIANVVRNAVSVSRAGQKVRVERTVEDHGPASAVGSHARVSVSDEGPGVPAELRATLFSPFMTHPVRNQPERVGIGLGLTLAREVARAHGGEIELLEPSGPGATFVLWLPLEANARSAGAETTTEEGAT